MKIKFFKTLLVVSVLLTGCTTKINDNCRIEQCSQNNNESFVSDNVTEQDSVITIEEVITEDSYEPPIILANCQNCNSPQELRAHFEPIDYEKMYKHEELVIRDIHENLFKTHDVKLKKDVFFKAMLPIAHRINEEISEERVNLLKGKNLAYLKKKYKTNDVEELKRRVNIIPNKMILAQAAIESAYGTSRFAIEGNALFGQWTTHSSGMQPKEKPNSKWKVARFETPLDSARSYALNINTHPSYKKLRELRAKGLNPIDGLADYSQKGDGYMKIMNSIIKSNKLESLSF